MLTREINPIQAKALLEKGETVLIDVRKAGIDAGGVILGVILEAVFAPGFYALSDFVGAGLLFAGVTGTCGMAQLLSFAPWNRT